MVNPRNRLYRERDLEVVWPRVANTLADQHQAEKDPTVRQVLIAILEQYVEEEQASETIKESFQNRKASLFTNMGVKITRILQPEETSATAGSTTEGAAHADIFNRKLRKRELKKIAGSEENIPELLAELPVETPNPRKRSESPGVDWQVAYNFLLPTLEQLREELAATQATLAEYKAAFESQRGAIAKLTAENQIYRSRFAASSAPIPTE